MSLFTQKMKMLTAVVLDGYSDAVVKALLEEGVMDFVHISQLDGEQASRLSSHKADIPTGAISDLRGRCENLMKLGSIELPPISKADVDALGKLDMEECRKALDRLSGSLASIREDQKNLSQRLVSCDELLSYVKEKKTEYLDLRVGTIAPDRKLDDFRARLSAYTAVVAQDGRGSLVSLSLRRDVSRIDEVMDKFGWTESPKADKDSLEIAARALEERRASLQSRMDELADQVRKKVADEGDDLRRRWILLRVSELSGHVESYFSYTRNTTLFSGWVPASRAGEVESVIYEAAKGKCIIEWTEDSEVDRSSIPTSVSSAKVLSPFERMVKNYGTPEYGSINPTPFTTVAYIIMFALMFADVGQGLILLLIGIIGGQWYRRHPMAKDGLISRYLCSLLMFLGPASMVGGALFGSYFGYSWLPAIWFNYHAVVNGHAEGGLVSSVYDILGITIKFGIAVIFTGLVLNWINLVRKRRFLELVFDKNGLVGGVMYALGIYACYYFVDTGYRAFPTSPALYIGLCICLLLIIVKGPVYAAHKAKLSGHREKVSSVIVDTIMDFFVQVLEIFSSFLSNTLSFMRVAGLGIAHVSLMTAFEDMAAMTGNALAYVLIMILGNVIVIAIEGLSAGIQSLRLNYYEFFTKYFTGHGIAYEPVGLKSRVVID